MCFGLFPASIALAAEPNIVDCSQGAVYNIGDTADEMSVSVETDDSCELEFT